MTAPSVLLAQTYQGPSHPLVVGVVAAVAGAGWLIWLTVRRRPGRGDDRG
jgi:hypothetical protein